MTVEQIAIRQEIRQLLCEAGFNKNTMKDVVREVIDEELNKAVRQVLHETDLDGLVHRYASGNLQEAIKRELRDSIDNRVRGVFNRMTITVDVKDKDGSSSITR
jgi:hypothetical protein